MSNAKKFGRMRQSAIPRGSLNRRPPAAKAEPSGRFELNTNLTEAADLMAAAKGLGRDQYVVTAGGDSETKCVAIYIEKIGTEASVGLHRDEDGLISFNIAGLYEDYSELRPLTTVRCKAVVEPDADGVPCIQIHMGSAVVVRSNPRRVAASS